MNAVTTAPPRAFSEPGVVAGATPQALVPTTFEGVFRMAQVIAISGMAPKGMDTPEACTVAIMNGLEIGLTPMQAVQSIAVVNGRPTVWGDAAKALCLGSPMCEDIIETITGTGDDMVARCEAKRKGKSPSIGEFSVAKAKKAALWDKAGPWKQYPERMLQLRARAFALRDAFPDILRGVAIREEMEDVVDVRDVPPPTPPSPPAPPPATKAITVSTTAKADTPPAEVTSTKTEPVAPLPSEEAGAVEDATVVDPDAVIQDLITNLARCTTAEAIEEGYEFSDVEAALSGFTSADYVARARAIKKEYLDRVAPAPASEDPPAPPASPEPVASLDDDPPPPPKKAGLVDLDAYELYITTQLAKLGNEAAIREWWSNTRDTRNQFDLDADTRARLQNMVTGIIEKLPSGARIKKDGA
jgi:hypothetical protein